MTEESTTTEPVAIEQPAQVAPEPVTEEKTGFDLLLEEVASLKTRVAALEDVAHSGHTIDAPALDAIATNVFGRINEHLRGFFGKRA